MGSWRRQRIIISVMVAHGSHGQRMSALVRRPWSGPKRRLSFTTRCALQVLHIGRYAHADGFILLLYKHNFTAVQIFHRILLRVKIRTKGGNNVLEPFPSYLVSVVTLPIVPPGRAPRSVPLIVPSSTVVPVPIIPPSIPIPIVPPVIVPWPIVVAGSVIVPGWSASIIVVVPRSIVRIARRGSAVVASSVHVSALVRPIHVVVAQSVVLQESSAVLKQMHRRAYWRQLQLDWLAVDIYPRELSKGIFGIFHAGEGDNTGRKSVSSRALHCRGEPTHWSGRCGQCRRRECWDFPYVHSL